MTKDIEMQTELNTPARSITSQAIAQANEIQALEDRALELEFRLEDLLEVVPDRPGHEGDYRRQLSELADTYQQLARHYKGLAAI